ncbi:MAG: hypothetical protein WCA64_11525 [Gallionella sp.]
MNPGSARDMLAMPPACAAVMMQPVSAAGAFQDTLRRDQQAAHSGQHPLSLRRMKHDRGPAIRIRDHTTAQEEPYQYRDCNDPQEQRNLG